MQSGFAGLGSGIAKQGGELRSLTDAHQFLKSSDEIRTQFLGGDARDLCDSRNLFLVNLTVTVFPSKDGVTSYA